ncbi:hypothetical protein [Sporomusa silvacetica]|uniref:hypothetical protein n=1 Tax=Sporomusa silvacetica TaxID=55504 RepID=UPI0035A10916
MAIFPVLQADSSDILARSNFNKGPCFLITGHLNLNSIITAVFRQVVDLEIAEVVGNGLG